MTRRVFSCYGCTQRSSGCHSTCERYLKEKLAVEIESAIRKKKYDAKAAADQVRIEGAARISRSGKKPRER